ncbi:hypothetical protein [Phytoactinopolyspora limicola]|uniref:hypothetical protein n=1 Tax=Phytoactinopolyspora limicola TaxID=2715536 RepID=UPI00140CAD7B|nr:hypothetical protein [Phytoactinopolyspora limicola]
MSRKLRTLITTSVAAVMLAIAGIGAASTASASTTPEPTRKLVCEPVWGTPGGLTAGSKCRFVTFEAKTGPAVTIAPRTFTLAR